MQVDLLQKEVVRIESLQKNSDDCIEMLTREGEDSQRKHTALLQTIQDLREREKASGDVIQQLELTIKGETEQIKRHEGGRLSLSTSMRDLEVLPGGSRCFFF